MKEAKHVERVRSSQWSVANRGGRMNGEGMSSPRLVPSRRYAFCQELSPELAYEGGPCTCFRGVR